MKSFIATYWKCLQYGLIESAEYFYNSYLEMSNNLPYYIDGFTKWGE